MPTGSSDSAKISDGILIASTHNYNSMTLCFFSSSPDKVQTHIGEDKTHLYHNVSLLRGLVRDLLELVGNLTQSILVNLS